jgi:hypothetical protein
MSAADAAPETPSRSDIPVKKANVLFIQCPSEEPQKVRERSVETIYTFAHFEQRGTICGFRSLADLFQKQ